MFNARELKLPTANSELYVNRVNAFPKTLSARVTSFPITLEVNIQYIDKAAE